MEAKTVHLKEPVSLTVQIFMEIFIHLAEKRDDKDTVISHLLVHSLNVLKGRDLAKWNPGGPRSVPSTWVTRTQVMLLRVSTLEESRIRSRARTQTKTL